MISRVMSRFCGCSSRRRQSAGSAYSHSPERKSSICGASGSSWRRVSAASCADEPFYVGCCMCPPGSVDRAVDCRPDAGPDGLPEGAACGGDLGTCAEGLSCCYPCGIPGCENRCEPTCAPGTPGCFDGCFLRP